MSAAPRDDATEAQVTAADPTRSTWLSANAGSGKTRVLTDRVARLLIDGCDPQSILCLTYTKAAAGEMQNRLFGRLGEWAMLDEDKLRANLMQAGLGPDVDLDHARTLFARAIETPGGLKIQTIHSFASSLLRRFPVEAGLSPRFTELDDSAQTHLIRDVLDELARGHAPGFDGLVPYLGGTDIEEFAKTVAKERARFLPPREQAEIYDAFGLKPQTRLSDILAEAFPPGSDTLIAKLIALLETGSTNDLKAAAKLKAITSLAESQALTICEGVFLDRSNYLSKAGSFPTKARREADPALTEQVNALMARVEAARAKRLALDAADRATALHAFAATFLPAYAAAKQERGLVDFDDLIDRATTLLSDPARAAWVRYRIDGALDHVLVDEAQDTSPAQWQLIERLTEDLGTGAGSRSETRRTLFVVGDMKQSIYSFQGADAAEFDRRRAYFRDRLAGAGNAMDERLLRHSFRSSRAILETVDATFTGQAADGLGDTITHLAYHDDLPGRVDLWPLVPKAEDPPSRSWTDPVDLPAEENEAEILCRAIAGEIARLVATEHLTTSEGVRRPITAGDFLILVQGRTGSSGLFHRLIRACKSAGLPVAGADRLRLGAELAVRDLRALLTFLSLPEDDLSLAAALRSPLFGWSEGELYDLAADREQTYLWATLRARRDAFADTLAVLDSLRARADFLRPYELLEEILTRHGGRQKLLSRLGPECEDGIDELLNQALIYETRDVPSLTGFLAWLESENTEVKRQLDGKTDAVRVMTTHGAKGLEAPIVILPDTLRTTDAKSKTVEILPNGLPAWGAAKDLRPPQLEEAVADRVTAADRERRRLLYVAMTRAENWLIVCGAGTAPDRETWYGTVEAGLQAADAVPLDMPTGPGLRLERRDWASGTPAEADDPPPPPPARPDWLHRAAPPVASALSIRRPSDLGGAKVLAGDVTTEPDDAEAALRLGRQFHLLLEHLPHCAPDERREVAAALLSHGEDAAPPEAAKALADHAGRLIDAPEFAFLFAPDTLAEVDISAHLPEIGARIHGAIDRLVVTPDTVTAIDFKTNRLVPDRAEDTPDGLLRQMGAYAAGLAQVFPRYEIRTAILWTAAPRLMVLPAALTTQALRTVSTS